MNPIDAAIKDLEMIGDCRTCWNKNPFCESNPDSCSGYKWCGMPPASTDDNQPLTLAQLREADGGVREEENVMAMKKKYYSWWPYIREIVRLYPERSQIPLTGVAFREYMDVKRAIEATEAMPVGDVRIRLIRMLHWDKPFTLTLEGIAQQIPCGRATASRWQRQFFEEVARNRGLID